MGDLFYPSIRVFLENAGEEEKRQFFQEIELMKDVGSHPNILSIFGFWIRSEPIMLIMEYVPHGDLLQWLRNKRQQVKLVHRFFFAIFTFSNINFCNPFCRHVQSGFHSSRDTGQFICISLHTEIYIETAFARDPHTSTLICKLRTHTLHWGGGGGAGACLCLSFFRRLL